MAIPKENFPALTYLLEIEVQCTLAKHCLQQLERGTPWYRSGAERTTAEQAAPIELMAQSVAMLAATAVISKVLFGASNAVGVQKRCSRLTELLGLDKGAIPKIASRDARNGVEHVDERLDNYFGMGMGRTQSYRYGIQVDENPPDASEFVARHLNPLTLVFTAPNGEIDLRACNSELAVIGEAVKRAIAKLEGQPFPL
jgi:hypothetical protein